MPGTRPDQPTVISDLSGQERTVITDLSGAMTQVGPPPSPLTAHTALTVAPGADIQDAIPTHLSDPDRRNPSGTDVTDLHVGTGQPHASAGTHLGEVWGDFQFIRLLGRGGMGAVYLGKQISLDRQVAIKVLPSHLSENEQFRERFQLEAKAVAKMSSPHVVQVFAAGIYKGHHYFAMEYVEGEDLSRKLRGGFKPSYRQALDLVLQGAKGLAAAGENGIVHRDIKPGNMMIDRKGSLKIMDFGLVRLASAGHSLTMSGTVMGTVSYFSPEQGRGEPCDQRTDLYALGVVFYELLTGRLPFTGENATSIIYQHIHAPPKAPRELDPNIPEHYQAVVLKCMQKRADDRYASATDLVADLERIAAGAPPAIALERPDLLQSGATIIGSGSLAPTLTMPRPARSRGPLIGGLVVTEQVFNLNGIGQLFVQSVARNDFTLIQGMVMLIAAFYVFVNLAIDLLYAVFDPRIRYA
ncbi:MAG: protein kinase [Planctomycetes bacterium]|nr:protein kinase [Planctomycetota bacterium]